jgi:PAS domain S-box-containing protein
MPSAENELSREKEKFEALFQNASLGILVVNQLGEIVLVNNFLLTQFGYVRSEELMGEKIEKLIPRRFHPVHIVHREKYNNNPKNRPMGVGMDLVATKKNGDEFPVEVSLGSYQNEDGQFVIAFVSDITKRKQTEDLMLAQQKELSEINLQVEKFNEELEQKINERTKRLQETLEQLKASRDELENALSKEKELGDLKSRFVSMASHEFRTPLSTILSSASLLAKYTLSDEQEKRNKHIQRIKSGVNNLTDILNEFLSLGKMEDGKVEANYTYFNMKDMIQSLCNEIGGVAKKGQQLMYKHSGDVVIYLDCSFLKNIIINLVSNAIKFSPENSKIYISSSVDNKGIHLSISDTGIGIAQNDQKHLFERFFRGKNVTNIQGTGLGLHIVGKYVELMDGQIDFISELEKGTTFDISFKTS